MTRAIVALVEIMSDTDAPLRRRIEATEGLLAYEAPKEAVHQAQAFLISVFGDPEQRVEDWLDALKLMREAEARKITAPTVTTGDARANRELLATARNRQAPRCNDEGGRMGRPSKRLGG